MLFLLFILFLFIPILVISLLINIYFIFTLKDTATLKLQIFALKEQLLLLKLDREKKKTKIEFPVWHN